MAVASEGAGYWLVTAAGDVVAFGAADASFAVPAGAAPAHPVVAVAGTPSGQGFRVTDGQGKVYGFGDAAVAGDASGCQLPAGIVGLAASADGTISPAPADRPNCGLDPPTTTSTSTTTTTTTPPPPPSAAAVMIVWQDDPFNGSSDTSLVATLKSRTIKFGKPVVLVHGDSHSFTLDHPWPTVANFTRVETYGDAGTNKWVKATVDPNKASVFSFTTITS